MTEVGKCIRTIDTDEGKIDIYSLRELEEKGIIKDLSKMPYSIKIIVESMLRQRDGKLITDKDVVAAASWDPKENSDDEIPWIPARVLLQDLTGGAAVTDLASMRAAVDALGFDGSIIDPLVPVDLVIDHSVQTDYAGRPDARELNEELEFERNKERYALFKWAQDSFKNFRVVPPGNGICHQVNLEYLSPVVHVKDGCGNKTAYPDSCFGTDSHTTQINGLGVAGWGVGGIEAEAVMVGQPSYMKLPDVVGFRLKGKLRPEVNATDLVLTCVQMLRKKGVVGKFVEFCGPGYAGLELADRATLANMAPEYGATMGYCPIDGNTIEYLRLTGRDAAHIDAVERYAKEQTLWYDGEAEYTDMLELDLGTVEPSLAGHKRPQDRIPLSEMKNSFSASLRELGVEKKRAPASGMLGDGSVVIASITSCTNTANPSVMIAAGLLAKKACELGLEKKDFVKTSLAPGSKVVTEYLKSSGLLPFMEKLGFQVCGYGCMTCIGNSGPLSDDVSRQIKADDLAVAAVASSNRNFEGRIHPLVKANYLASPPLVIAYAIAGRIDIDFDNEPIGQAGGREVYLRDIWPDDADVEEVKSKFVDSETFAKEYRNVFKGSERWDRIPCERSPLFAWDENSTYIRNPPFFDDIFEEPAIRDIEGARCLAMLGDSITTDHISPAGDFPADSDAGRYLMDRGVEKKDFNSYGSRRANHEIMVRGTFANIRLRNRLVPGSEGSRSIYLPDGSVDTIFETSGKYLEERTPLIVLAGKEYGTGSSRDWAAKGPLLLGVKAVIAESFERIHRSNLIGMGIVPLQFLDGQNAEALKLDGTETFDIDLEGLEPKCLVGVTAYKGGMKLEFDVLCRADVPAEIDYLANGGILQYVLRNMIL
ncbi:MAG: aconitate hydratase AcnA [Candidatus Methanomethylophilaceae archaeon]|jgi:aconitate hydratase|nr:aconitate hydratase AcnA [Candidatus Methanomethylophilaceae archaeon]MDD4708643.1 aconitate hydratase AcnA [Candidatus Methanomethylophilaceae archaeon]